MDYYDELEMKLQLHYNAVDVEVTDEGVFAYYIDDETFTEEKNYWVKEFLQSEGLFDVDSNPLEDGTYVVYGFWNELEECDCEDEEDCDCDEYDYEDELEEGQILERKTVLKVNSKGKRRRKVICGKGKKFVDGKCVAQRSKEKIAMRIGKIKARRTQKTKGSAKKRRTKILKNRAMKKRRAQGL